MTKIWRQTEEWPEGKYLVVRRDGTIPDWRHFVLSENDPCVPAALQAYANAAEELGWDVDYVSSVRAEAFIYEQHQALGQPTSDPWLPPHRPDLPLVLAMMRHQFDFRDLSAPAPGATSMELLLLRQLDQVLALLASLVKDHQAMALKFSDVTAAVAAQTTLQNGVLTLLSSLSDQLQTIHAQTDDSETQDALQGVLDGLSSQSAALAAAITANTPAATPAQVAQQADAKVAEGVSTAQAQAAAAAGPQPTASTVGVTTSAGLDPALPPAAVDPAAT